MKGVVIGKSFTGKNAAANTQTGVFWAVLPDLSPDERLLQRALLAPLKSPPVMAAMIVAAGALK